MGSGLRVTGRSAQHHSTVRPPKTNAWPSFRSTRSHVPRPVSSSDWAESQKIAAIRASGTEERLAVCTLDLMTHILTTGQALGYASAAAGCDTTSRA